MSTHIICRHLIFTQGARVASKLSKVLLYVGPRKRVVKDSGRVGVFAAGKKRVIELVKKSR